MVGKLKGFLGENQDILTEAVAVLIVAGLYFILNEKYDFGLIYSVLLIIIATIIIILGIKYLREKNEK